MDRIFTKIIIIFWVAMCCTVQGIGQDIHYTQFYQSPLTLNPAMNGHIEGKYRLNVMYRTQWTNISNKGAIYQTPSASFDINLGGNTSRNSWGIGAMVFNDQTAGGLTNLTMLLGLAYHLNIDRAERHYLSGGIQVGFIQKRIDLSNLTFGNQFNPNYENPTNSDDNYFDPSIDDREDFDNDKFSFPDMRIGLIWSSYIEKIVIKAGFAYMHLLGGGETYYSFESALPSRLVLHGDFKIPFEGGLFIRPNLLYMNQAKASQVNIGTHIGYTVGNNFEAYIGGGMRLGDAFLATVGLDYKGFKLGVSYDMNTSLLDVVSNRVGAYELSLTYSGASANRVKPLLPAVRFF